MIGGHLFAAYSKQLSNSQSFRGLSFSLKIMALFVTLVFSVWFGTFELVTGKSGYCLQQPN